jgi:hypothetical protein
MTSEPSLQGWAPEPGPGLTLGQIVDHAFDYRGDVTVVKTDGVEVVGYLFNRDADAAEPFVEMFDRAGEGPLRIRYADIRTIRFTGRDTAAGTSYEAWRARRAEAGGAAPAPPVASAGA